MTISRFVYIFNSQENFYVMKQQKVAQINVTAGWTFLLLAGIGLVKVPWYLVGFAFFLSQVNYFRPKQSITDVIRAFTDQK